MSVLPRSRSRVEYEPNTLMNRIESNHRCKNAAAPAARLRAKNPRNLHDMSSPVLDTSSSSCSMPSRHLAAAAAHATPPIFSLHQQQPSTMPKRAAAASSAKASAEKGAKSAKTEEKEKVGSLSSPRLISFLFCFGYLRLISHFYARNHTSIWVHAQTPYDLYFDKLQAKQKAMGSEVLGQLLIKGIPRSSDDSDEEDEESDEEEEDTSKFTAKQMSTLRYVFITQNRSDQLDQMREYILGDQANDTIMMFNTSFSYGIHDGFFQFKSGRYAKKAKTPAAKFDMLFAYTFQLMQYDVWMQDNEGDMDGMVAELAGMWKRLLKNDDEALGIDAEYTRPGILQLLEDFKKRVEACYSEPPFKFKYK